MWQDVWFYAFIGAVVILGWIVSGTHGVAKGLHVIIEQLGLERDAQARTIQWQRRVIAQLEKKVERVPGDILIDRDN